MARILNIFIGCAALLLVAGMSTPAAAQPGFGPPGHGHGRGGGMGGKFKPGFIEKIAAELGVSASTVRKIKDLAFKSEQQHIKLRAEVDMARLELRRLMDADQPNVGQVMKQVEAVGRVETELKKNRIGLMLAVRGHLSPAQRDKLQQIISERRDEKRMHRGRRGGGGGGSGMRPQDARRGRRSPGL